MAYLLEGLYLKFKYFIITLLLTLLGSSFAFASKNRLLRLKEETKREARHKLDEVLLRYCGQFCQLIDLSVEVDEEIPDGEDMGFEAIMGNSSKGALLVSKLEATIQIDERVGVVNRDRLGNILKVHLGSLAAIPIVVWKSVRLPRITKYGEGEPGYVFESFSDTENSDGNFDFRPQEYSGKAQKLRDQLDRQIGAAIKKVIQNYCPNQCILERVEIFGSMVSPKDAVKLPRSQQIRDSSGRSIFQIDNVEVDVTMDSSITEESRQKIAAVMRSKLRFASPLNLNIGVIDFPESYAAKRAAKQKDASDPYGLNKLRDTLIMFRDLAGTKEIITTTKTDTKSSSIEKNSENSKSSSNNQENTDGEMSMEEWTGFFVIVLLVLGLIGYLLVKASRSKKDADEMMAQSPMGINVTTEAISSEKEGGEYKDKDKDNEEKEQLALLLKINELKEELVNLFMENPRVAKETFSRFLKEDGVENTAKYVHVFGHLIVFELLKDPNFQRELYELSEYYHNSEFNFTREEEYDLLLKLKTRCTASEIRIRTRRSSEKFEFLSKLDAMQVFSLIKDEKVQVQVIVMTQLERKKRLQVFEMYVGEEKVKLMSELSNAETIPKEFLFNVAKALSKKVATKPEFDTENLRTSDILLDLMEKAPIEEQKGLMSTLQQNNPETARSIKMKLVTINMLPYLKDGHLLELVLGMDREDLLGFLSSTDEMIRDLILRKAPEELSDSWLEDLESFAAPDESSSRVVEMAVVNKIRNLANNGVISLLEINNLIFDDPASSGDFETDDNSSLPRMNNSSSAA